MRFRQFIEAGTGLPTRLPFVGKPRTSGPFNFPDLTRPQQPGEMPMGGYHSFSQMVHHHAQQEPNEYYSINTLTMLSKLATNIYQAVQMRANQQPTQLYPNAYWDANAKLLGGIQPRELQSAGGYRMLEPQ